MRNKLKKYLLNEFEESYKCNVTPEQIMEKTDFFKKVNLVYYNRPTYRKGFLIASCMVMLLLFVVATLAISNNKLSTTISRWDDLKDIYSSYDLTTSDLQFLNGNSEKVYKNSLYSLLIDQNYDLIVYKGYKYVEHQKAENIYFYKIVVKSSLGLSNIRNNKLIIKCNNTTKVITENNLIGILTTTSYNNDNSYDDIQISITRDGFEKDYVLSILNSL